MIDEILHSRGCCVSPWFFDSKYVSDSVSNGCTKKEGVATEVVAGIENREGIYYNAALNTSRRFLILAMSYKKAIKNWEPPLPKKMLGYS